MPRRTALFVLGWLLLPRVPAQFDTEPSPLPPPAPPSRIRLFRIQPGFVSDLPWLDPDERSSETDWVSFSAGNDNPYFELRQPGDPGGLGFTRVNSQVQLWGSDRTSFALGVQAVTPRGIEDEGLADCDGATVVSPALALFHTLDDGLALQAYVGKNLPLTNAAARPVRRQVQYGVAVQQSLSTEASDPLSALFVSLGALGQGGAAWEVLPGLHWQPGQAWWMSAGYSLPLGAPRGEFGQWQVTCSWQF